jgi:ubiquinone/menaquinone biosynthesis C-methylase UbiE
VTVNVAPTQEAQLNAHYGRADLSAIVLRALKDAGKNLDALSVDDLAALDQFHTRGRDATLDLAQRAGFTPAMHVLDVGGGLGGPARTLASQVGCRVTVLDLTEAFCRLGEKLTQLTGLSERVTFRHASALDMPFAAHSFDALWTQNSSMNIADKEGLYREIHRVLKPGGRLALQEIMEGDKEPVCFPVPWAREASLSFLRPAEAMRRVIRDAGFAERTWIDDTALAQKWYQARMKTLGQGTPALGIHLLLGEQFSEMSRNQMRNIEERRIVIIQAVFEKE